MFELGGISKELNSNYAGGPLSYSRGPHFDVHELVSLNNLTRDSVRRTELVELTYDGGEDENADEVTDDREDVPVTNKNTRTTMFRPLRFQPRQKKLIHEKGRRRNRISVMERLQTQKNDIPLLLGVWKGWGSQVSSRNGAVLSVFCFEHFW